MPSIKKVYSLEELVSAVAAHPTQAAAARALGIEPDTLGKRLARAKKKGKIADDPFPVVPQKSILYDAQTGEEKLVWTKGGKGSAVSAEEIIEGLENVLKNYKPPKRLKPNPHQSNDLLGLWSLADLHMGMRAWGKETDGPDWDIKIATECYQEGLAEVTAMTPPVEKGIVLVAGDLGHADNFHQGTSNPNTHHVVDTDGRYPRILEASVDIVAYSVDMALQKAHTVEVVIKPGNHDAATAVAVRLILAAMFKDDPRVTVCKSPSPYWWYEWGQCMFACTHGDKANMARLPEYMSDIMAPMWGRCKHRYAFLGHLHKKLVEQRPGVRIELLPTPVAPDSFSSSMGFRSPRMFETRVYHKDKGLRQTPTVIL